MCRRFDPLFRHSGDWTLSFRGTFSHPPTPKRSFGVLKLPTLTEFDFLALNCVLPSIFWGQIFSVQRPNLAGRAERPPALIGNAWWRREMEAISALLAICEGKSPVTGEFPAQRPVTRNLNVFFDLRLNKRLSKQSWGWWFETLSCPLWRQCNGVWNRPKRWQTYHNQNLKVRHTIWKYISAMR